MNYAHPDLLHFQFHPVCYNDDYHLLRCVLNSILNYVEGRTHGT